MQKQRAITEKQLGKMVSKAKIKQEASKNKKHSDVTAAGKKRGRKAADPN